MYYIYIYNYILLFAVAAREGFYETIVSLYTTKTGCTYIYIYIYIYIYTYRIGFGIYYIPARRISSIPLQSIPHTAITRCTRSYIIKPDVLGSIIVSYTYTYHTVAVCCRACFQKTNRARTIWRGQNIILL
jgi:hypothetical protein